jgi:stage V sporulation protein D (sporulation-specific penicillin-binding protein)
MTEELSDKERAELEALHEKMVTPEVLPEQAATDISSQESSQDEDAASQEDSAQNSDNKEDSGKSSIWQSFDVDPTTGYYIDPETGDLLDPNNGSRSGSDTLPDFSESVDSGASEGSNNG